MYRNITISAAAAAPRGDVAIALFEKTTSLPSAYASLDRDAGGAISAALKRSEFSTAKGALGTVYAPASATNGGARIFVVGLGSAAKVNAETLRTGAAKLLRAAFAAKVASLTLWLRPGLGTKLDNDTAGRAIGDGVAIANFEFETFKGKGWKPANSPAPKPVDLALAADLALVKPIERALLIGESANLTRTLAATPPNVANPSYVAAFCQKMSKQAGLKCTVIDAKRAKALNMGGLLAVGSAGSTPPAMIVMEWDGGKKAASPVLLVGKAITFDSGGISIKPAEAMDKMKYDKCGGMAVIGAMQAIARLKLPINVVGIVPCAENLLSDKAYRPADILTHHNGVTSEIINTDAEGRLVLADALAYGTRKYKPRAVVDLATLTGACVVALGSVCAGAFCGDTKFRSHLFDAAEFTGERLWHMPLWDEHRQAIKGTHGDILNAGGREAGACTAAAFLSFFIEPDGPNQLPQLPWCHLDIAGVADVKGDTPLYAKGPTGFGVRLLVRALETWK